MSNLLLEAALQYGELGFRVFPVVLTWNPKKKKGKGGWDKKPTVSGGFHDGTTDPDKILLYFSSINSSSGIGMVHERMTVVDADDELGVSTLNRILPRLPEASVVTRTISGSIHYIVAGETPGSRDVKGMPGIDFLTGNTGYLVVPPTLGYSVITGSFDQLAEDIEEMNSERLGPESEDGEGSR